MSPHLRLVLALLLPFAAAGLQWLLWDPWIRPYVWFLFFPVAFFSAWLAGLNGGIGATALSALLVWFVFIPPRFSFELQSASGGFSIAVFVIMGCLFAWFHEKLQRALHSSEVRFETTFEQAAVGVALATPEGRFLRVNRQLCTITGYSAGELTAMSFQDITHPDDLQADLANLRRALAREIDRFSMEKRYVRKDGSHVWVSLVVSLVRKPDGVPDHFIAVIEDITALKRAEAALREREHRLEAIVRHSPSALSLKHPDGRYALANPNLQHIHHLDEAQIVGKTDFDLYPGDSARIFQANDRHVLETLSRCSIEEIVPVDGVPRTYLSHMFPVLDDAGQAEYVCRISLDVTDRKRVEAEMAGQLDELTRFNRASIGREFDMIRLKREVNTLARELGRPPPYDLAFADKPVTGTSLP